MAAISHVHERAGSPAQLNSAASVHASNNASVHVGNNYNTNYSPKDNYLKDLWVTNPEMDKKRIEAAKGGLVEESYTWILENPCFKAWRDDPKSHLLWIKGDPGKGKTMLLCGIINELKKPPDETLLSYFFCQATDLRLNNATAILRGLISMLIRQRPPLKEHVLKYYEAAGNRLFEDSNAFFSLSKIFEDIIEHISTAVSLERPNTRAKGAYIIIDALDECGENFRKQLLGLIVKTASSEIKWIVSSRYRGTFEHGLFLNESRAKLSLELKENAEQVNRAVDLYIKTRVSELFATREDENLQNQIRDKMRRKADGTFLWISLVLEEVIRTGLLLSELPAKMDEFPAGLNELYVRMKIQIEGQGDRANICRRLLATVVVALRPLRLEELRVVSGLATLPVKDIKSYANMCGSFLTFQGDTVFIIHKSAKDFLYGDRFFFPSGISEVHHTIYLTSLKAMSLTLQRKNVYKLGHIGSTLDDIIPPSENPLAPIQYSCVFWVHHLEEVLRLGDDRSGVASGNLGVVSHVVPCYGHNPRKPIDLSRNSSRLLSFYTINELQKVLNAIVDSPLGMLFRIAWKRARAIMISFATSAAILKVVFTLKAFLWDDDQSAENPDFDKTILPQWNSDLVDSAEVRSFLEEKYLFWLEALSLLRSIPEGVDALMKLERLVESYTNDSTLLKFARDARRFCLQQGSLFKDAPLQVYVSALLFSPQQSVIRKQYEEAELEWITTKPIVEKYWDPCLRVPVANHGIVGSVAFSPDGKLIATGLDYETVKLWKTDNATCLTKFNCGDAESLSSVAFSPCGKQIATASDDSIKLWCIESAKCRKTMECDENVLSVAFSPEGDRLASSLSDGSAKLWDPKTGICQMTLMNARGESSRPFKTMFGPCSNLSFSPDGQTLAVASDEIYLWDIIKQDCRTTLNQHEGRVFSVAFSEDGKLVASGGLDGTIKLWNPQNSHCQWSRRLGSSRNNPVYTVAFSPDGKYVASGSTYRLINLWDPATGNCQATLAGHASMVMSVAFSPDSQRLVSGAGDRSFRIWDLTDSNIQKPTIRRHHEVITGMALSPDKKHVASTSADFTIKLWDTSTGDYLKTLDDQTDQTWTTPNPAVIAHDEQPLPEAVADSLDLWWFVTQYNEHTVLGDRFRSIITTALTPDGALCAIMSHATKFPYRDFMLSDSEIDEPRLVARLYDDKPTRENTKLFFHPSGTYLGYSTCRASEREPVFIWDISNDPDEMISPDNADLYEYTDEEEVGDGWDFYPRVRLEDLSSEDQCLLIEAWDASVNHRGLSDDRKWITCHGQNSILLPSDYRTEVSVSTDNMIAIAGRRGDVIILRFQEDVFSDLD